jgi:hypothetical protein
MTPDTNQCCKLAQEAATASAAYGGISIEIRLLTERGYHLYSWTGQPPEALLALASVQPIGGEQ